MKRFTYVPHMITLALLAAAGAGAATVVNLSTYYPSPTGNYDTFSTNNLSIGTTAAPGTAKLTLFNGTVTIGTTTASGVLTIKSLASTGITLIPIPSGAGISPNSTQSAVHFGSATAPNHYGFGVGRDSGADGGDDFFIFDQIGLRTRYNISSTGTAIAPYGGNLGIGIASPRFTLDVVGMQTLPANFHVTSCLGGGCPGGVLGDRLTIPANGNVGINQTNPTEKLDVIGTMRASGTMTLSGGPTALRLATGSVNSGGDLTAPNITASSATATGDLESGGDVSVDGNTTVTGAFSSAVATLGRAPAGPVAGAAVTVNGDAVVQGNLQANLHIYIPSDRRLKKEIAPLGHALSDVMKLRGVRFQWNDTGKADIGIVAQDLEAVAPELVGTSPSGFKAVEYNKLPVLLIKTIQEQQVQIEELKKAIEHLKSRHQGTRRTP